LSSKILAFFLTRELLSDLNISVYTLASTPGKDNLLAVMFLAASGYN
jgi:hypothetical protein